MLDNTLKILRCVSCSSKLNFESFGAKESEGVLYCEKCNADFAVINNIPIMWDLSKYLENRIMLGNELIGMAGQQMKPYIKKKISVIKNPTNDIYLLEQKWVRIYKNSKNSEFYDRIKEEINSLPNLQDCIEYGCSIGVISNYLSKHSSHVYGMDKSFSAINHAKLESDTNTDYIVSDILLNPFENVSFDFIVALNILELVEPQNLLDLFSKQIQNGSLLMSSPYDYDRGPKTVSKPLDEIALRDTLRNCGFKILEHTNKPIFIPWNLEINSRTKLNYLCDLVLAQKNQVSC